MGRPGRQGLEYLDLEHPYAADLDLFGAGSLFERLCTARTRAGEETLASWLLAPATPETIRRAARGDRRAAAPARPARRPRAAGSRGPGGHRPGRAGRLVVRPDASFRAGSSVVATILAVLGTVALVGWLVFECAGILPLLVVLTRRWRSSLGRCPAAFERSWPPSISGLTTSSCSRSCSAGWSASHSRRPSCNGWSKSSRPMACRIEPRSNGWPGCCTCWIREEPVLHAVWRFFWLWTIQLALRIDAWRSRSGRTIGQLARAAIGEFEALCALAAYAAENPPDPFAEIVAGPPASRPKRSAIR